MTGLVGLAGCREPVGLFTEMEVQLSSDGERVVWRAALSVAAG